MKTIHLLSDEQLVVQWLSQYGPLPIELVRTWLSYKPQNIQDKILKNLLIHGFIYQVAENILTIDPTTVIPNEDIVRAGWVLSRLDGIDPHAHYPARFPAQIHFLSHQFGVDIMVIHPGSEHLMYLLESNEHLKYIFVIEDLAQLPLAVPDGIPYMIACAPSPSQITFYTRRDSADVVFPSTASNGICAATDLPVVSGD